MKIGIKERTIKIFKTASTFLVLAFVVIVFESWLTVDSMPKSISKKMNSGLAEFWGDQSVKLENSNWLSDDNKMKLLDVGVEGLFTIKSDHQKLGYVVIVRARSKFDYFDYAIYYDPKLIIKGVRVLQYREDYGGEIANKRWLKQFEGLTVQSPIAIDNDIQGISGATVSYRAITSGVKEVTGVINTLNL